MCGIGGFVMRRAISPREPAEARLWRMIATLRHRGPDDEGVWTDGRAGLAHARLSIIDLSPAAHQPMTSADETVLITYNGEVYNFAELRQRLIALSYPFHSRNDTEANLTAPPRKEIDPTDVVISPQAVMIRLCHGHRPSAGVTR